MYVVIYVCMCVFSHIWLFATPWTVAHQVPLFMEFSRQEYWNGLLFPPLGDLPDSGIRTPVYFISCIGRQILYHCSTWEAHNKNNMCHVWLFAAPWTVVHRAPLSMEFSRQKYWSELPFLSPGDLPNPGLNLGHPHCRQILYTVPSGKPIIRVIPTHKIVTKIK